MKEDVINTISTPEIKKIGNKLIEDYEMFDENLKKIINAVQSLDGAWHGTDAEKYLSKITGTSIPLMSKMSSIIYQYGTYLLKISERYESLEEKYSSRTMSIEE